jgi:hypothetical protein
VARVTTFDYVLAVNAKSSIQSMQDLVQLARKDPGKLNYASAGMGSGQHMYVELLRSAAGIQIQHIPYKGNAPAMQALLSGEVDLLFDTTLGMLPMVRAAAPAADQQPHTACQSASGTDHGQPVSRVGRTGLAWGVCAGGNAARGDRPALGCDQCRGDCARYGYPPP